MDQQLEHLLANWERQLEWKQRAHTDASRWITLKNSWVGYPAAALSAIVGTSIFASFLTGKIIPWVQIGAVVLSLSAAVLSAIQTQTRSVFLQMADQHRVAAAKYGNVRRKIERIRTSPEMNDAEKRQAMDVVQERFDKLDVKSPRIPKWTTKSWRAGKPPVEVNV